jgi:hypothetical protein
VGCRVWGVGVGCRVWGVGCRVSVSYDHFGNDILILYYYCSHNRPSAGLGIKINYDAL